MKGMVFYAYIYVSRCMAVVCNRSHASNLMKWFNTPVMAIYSLMAFVWLAYASLHSAGHHKSNLHVRNSHATNLLQRQAQAYKYLYNIDDKEIIARINLFDE